MSHFATLFSLLLLIAVTFTTPSAQAARGGGGLGGGSIELGFLGGVTNSSQDALNLLQARANTRAGGISTPALNSAYEAALQFGYRFQGTIFQMIVRPSYFYEKASGGNSTGDYSYGVTGMTLFPILRMYPLENEFMKFFLQFGLGYGRATTTITEQSANLTATGSSFGTLAGMGAKFCFNDSHCVSLEGNYRYMSIERNIVDDTSGTWASNSVSQAIKDHELEIDSDDAFVRMGGMQFLVGYIMQF